MSAERRAAASMAVNAHAQWHESAVLFAGDDLSIIFGHTNVNNNYKTKLNISNIAFATTPHVFVIHQPAGHDTLETASVHCHMSVVYCLLVAKACTPEGATQCPLNESMKS